MTVPVRPWYTGTNTLKTPQSGALQVIGSKSTEIRETIGKIDTTNTGSTRITASDGTTVIVRKTSIQSGAELDIQISGQYGAGNAGDPPQLGGTAMYGAQYLITQAGDTITDSSGGSTGLSMLIDNYTLRYSEGDQNAIEYAIQGHSTGGWARTVGTT